MGKEVRENVALFVGPPRVFALCLRAREIEIITDNFTQLSIMQSCVVRVAKPN